jgi:hypothetical protein
LLGVTVGLAHPHRFNCSRCFSIEKPVNLSAIGCLSSEWFFLPLVMDFDANRMKRAS